jgi:hypothetical protein
MAEARGIATVETMSKLGADGDLAAPLAGLVQLLHRV